MRHNVGRIHDILKVFNDDKTSFSKSRRNLFLDDQDVKKSILNAKLVLYNGIHFLHAL